MKPIHVVVFASCLAALHAIGAVKFVELGWDIPDTKFLRDNFRQMELEGPFDGVLFNVTVKVEGGDSVGTDSGWNRERWNKEWFRPALDDLKSCKFTKFTDNFIRFNATPKLIDWTDDEGWNALEGKLRICAWLAREGGAKGIAPDFEPYGENQWKFEPAKGKTFAETSMLARKRGAQFARGIGAEMPNAVVLTLFLNSVVLRAGRADDPDAILAKEHYGLLPAFLNGMLDAATKEMVIVDGCENGYYMDSAEAYQRAALDMRSWTGPAMRLVAPENRAKYRQQVQAGFGLYLDMFLNEEGNQYYRGPLDGSRLKHLSRNLAAARDAADEYVWIYGEQCRWWNGLAKDKPWRNEQLKKTVGKGRSWEEAMPGITRVITWSRDSDMAARAELAGMKSRRTATNLVTNADFSQKPKSADGLPPGWGAWQDERNPTGKFSWDESLGAGSARAAKVSWGCFIQKVSALPGETFVVQARCRAQGSGLRDMGIRWQTADGKWTHEIDDRMFTFKAGGDGWESASGVVTVPGGTGNLAILLGVRGQETSDDVCWFDDVELCRLPPLIP